MVPSVPWRRGVCTSAPASPWGSVGPPGHSRSAFLPPVYSHSRALAQLLLGPSPGTPRGWVISLSSPPCPTVQLAVGPMARDVESLALCLRALLCEDMFRLDPTVPPLPFREEVSRGGGGHGVGFGAHWCF